MFRLQRWRSRMPNDGDFLQFLNGFQYSRSRAATHPAAAIVTPTKRRRIELQDAATRGLAKRKPAKPAKAPRKRLKTITETATSRFYSSDAAPLEEPKKARRKTKTASKTEPPRPPELLSPSRARLLAESQDFIFGTSSQLASDEGADLIQQTIAAITESEHFLPSQPAQSPVKKRYTRVRNAQQGTILPVFQAEKELWCCAARDFKGGVHRDDSGLSKRRPPRLSASTPMDTGHASVNATPPKASPEGPRAKDKRPASGPCTSESTPSQQPYAKMPLQPKDANPRLITSHGLDNAYRKRGRPPKKKGLSAAVPAGIEEETFINIDDISDLEPPSTPSPPRRRASTSPRPLPTLELSPKGAKQRSRRGSGEALSSTAQLKKEDMQWQSIQKTLFAQITATVKAATRSTDSTNPTWYQKILLYDPIVLEDFTEWLTEQHIRIDVRRKKKAAPKSRKKKVRAEDGVGKLADEAEHTTEAVTEELQPWMVQRWCEESSVCCLWKEGLRGGVRSRY